MTYMLERNGTTYEFGHSVKNVGRGDFVKVGLGRIETIESIELLPGSKWDMLITTESGETYTLMQVGAYGKKA